MFGQFHIFRADLDSQITTTEILNKKSFTRSLFKIFPRVTVLFAFIARKSCLKLVVACILLV